MVKDEVGRPIGVTGLPGSTFRVRFGGPHPAGSVLAPPPMEGFEWKGSSDTLPMMSSRTATEALLQPFSPRAGSPCGAAPSFRPAAASVPPALVAPDTAKGHAQSRAAVRETDAIVREPAIMVT